ncbi:MAG: zinc ribbon domain-containing protein [Archangium sp.]
MKCTRCFTSLEHGDIRCPVCALIVPVRETKAVANRQVLRCNECNAAVAYSAKHQNPVCGFCGSVMRVEEPVDPVELPEARVKLSVTREEAQASLKEWLGRRGFFAPTRLGESTVDAVHPLWWAAWVCDVDAKVSWTADSNEGSGRSDWAPYAGQFQMQRLNLLISASRGLSAKEAAALTEHYDLAPTEPVPADSQEVEQFDAQRSVARRVVNEAITSEAEAEVKHRHVPGSRHRKIRAHAMMTGLSTRRLALPAWVMVYRFDGKPFRAVVHGQNVHVVLGESPISMWKVFGVLFGVMLALAVIGWIISLVAH